jgi:hypothetical protein
MLDFIATNGKYEFRPSEWKFIRRISRDEMANIVRASTALRFATNHLDQPAYLWPHGESIDAGNGDYLNLKGEYFHVELREAPKDGWVKLHQTRLAEEAKKWESGEWEPPNSDLIDTDPLAPVKRKYPSQPMADVIVDTHSRTCAECNWIGDHAPDCKRKLFGAFKNHSATVLISATPPRTKTQEVPVIDLGALRKQELDPDSKARRLGALTRTNTARDATDKWRDD